MDGFPLTKGSEAILILEPKVLTFFTKNAHGLYIFFATMIYMFTVVRGGGRLLCLYHVLFILLEIHEMQINLNL